MAPAGILSVNEEGHNKKPKTYTVDDEHIDNEHVEDEHIAHHPRRLIVIIF